MKFQQFSKKLIFSQFLKKFSPGRPRIFRIWTSNLVRIYLYWIPERYLSSIPFEIQNLMQYFILKIHFRMSAHKWLKSDRRSAKGTLHTESASHHFPQMFNQLFIFVSVKFSKIYHRIKEIKKSSIYRPNRSIWLRGSPR